MSFLYLLITAGILTTLAIIVIHRESKIIIKSEIDRYIEESIPTLNFLIANRRYDAIWDDYCGSFDLQLSEFMYIQEALLLEQIDFLNRCELGQRIIDHPSPNSLDTFRDNVPFTTHQDYIEVIRNQNMNLLPNTQYHWYQTSDDNGQELWIPFPTEYFYYFSRHVVRSMILASCKRKGHVSLNIGDVILDLSRNIQRYLGLDILSDEGLTPFKFIPPIHHKQYNYIQKSPLKDLVRIALVNNVDFIYGQATQLSRFSELLTEVTIKSVLRDAPISLSAVYRYIKGFVKAKLNRRGILPRDIWKIKGITIDHTEADIYKESISELWGPQPLISFIIPESLPIAIQAWNHKDMSLIPFTNFYEFIPYDDYKKSIDDKSFIPKTVFTNELSPGIYELVITNFHGGIFTRFRTNNLIMVTSTHDDVLGIDLPQLNFYAHANDVIDLAGMVRLSEEIVWRAINISGLSSRDWVARKEYSSGSEYIHFYIEDDESSNLLPDEIKTMLQTALREVEKKFADTEEIWGKELIQVTLLPSDVFSEYITERGTKSYRIDLAKRMSNILMRKKF